MLRGSAVAALLVLPFWARAARTLSDIVSPEKRQEIVAAAERLANPPAHPPIPAKIQGPFNPATFNPEQPAAAAPSGAAAQPSAPSDREILATLAAKIPVTGTIVLRGTPLLISGTNRIEVGSRFTVVYHGQQYELELVAINPTSFTVRYKGDETTVPIK